MYLSLAFRDPGAGCGRRDCETSKRAVSSRVPVFVTGVARAAASRRCFVRERHRENVPTRNLFFGDEIGDAMRDDSRLAGAGARENEERTLRGQHSFTLLLV